MADLDESLSTLLNDFNYFAKIAETIYLPNYDISTMDYYDYPITLFYLSLDKNQVETSTEAFVALYLKALYLNNGWYEDEVDQKLSHYLENIWIPEDFSRFRDKTTFLIPLSTMNDLTSLEEMSYWMRYFKVQSNELNAFKLKHIDATIIRIGKHHTRRYCFGETETTYFLTEFGA